MEIIQGKFAEAVSYAKIIDDSAREQIQRMCDNEFTQGSKIRIMPDVHAGMGCTIGTTMTIKDKIVPNIVGVDIGCGMYTVKLADQDIDFEKFDEACHYVPSGLNVWNRQQEKFNLQDLHCYKQLKNLSWVENGLGTLGGGNHFIEIDRASDGTNYLVIHTGSRNLGKQVAEIYQSLAVDLNSGNSADQRKALIKKYKAAGRSREIQTALQNLADNRRKTSIPADLCYVFGKYFVHYLEDMKICQQFARKNRELIAKILTGRAGLKIVEAFHTTHNYINDEDMIIRKGAIAAHKNERVLIPINMRDGSIIAIGKGNPDWNFSAPHGAGRLMSRTKAKNSLSMSDFKSSMAGIYTTSINESTLDESPMAYKSINDIIDVIIDTVEIVEIIKPVFNFKASE